MEEFYLLFQHSHSPNFNEEYGNQIYTKGMSLISQSNIDTTSKEKIIYKLLNIYPDNAKLYHEMGKLFDTNSIEKKIAWYKLSHNKDPTNYEYLYSLCKTLYEVFEYGQIIKLNKNKLFDKFPDNMEILQYYVSCKTQRKHYQHCLKYMEKIVTAYSYKKCITREDQIKKINNYKDLTHLYYLECKIEKAIQSMKKAFELSIKFQLPKTEQMTNYQLFIALHDYTYYNHEEHYQRYTKINELLTHTPIFSTIHTRNPSSKIKIGYITNEFEEGPVANFIYPILKHHDKSKFEIYLFPNKTSIPEKYKEIANYSCPILGGTDKDVATFINQQKVDILIDLMGYTTNNRLGIFAYRPAPVQITCLGYPNTTGYSQMDYRITDSIADHQESKQIYSETLLRMPKCFLLYDATAQADKLYYKFKPTENIIILGALNKEAKNTPFVLETWKQILKQSPNTHLLIKSDSMDGEEDRADFYSKKLDVDKSRLILRTMMPHNIYMELFTKIDILLDTFPYSGTTTTCHALSNSTPLVTLYNKDYHSHNVSASLLINSGLDELVTYSTSEYIDKVKSLIDSPNKIDEYKKTIKTKFDKLMEPKPFMEAYEKLLIDSLSKIPK